MSLELIREEVKVSRLIGSNSTQTVIENDIIVPDIKPDIVKIILLDGDVYIGDTDVMQDKILVNGTIQYKILYISDNEEENIKSINSSSNFSCGLDIDNARPGMKGRVKCEIEHMDFDILNGRKLNVKAVVKVEGKAQEETEYSVINNLRAEEDVQILKESIRINCFLGDNTEEYSMRESLEVPSDKPAMLEILRNDIKIAGKEYKATDGKIIAKGELNISTLYVGDDESRSIYFMEHQMPFTQFVDLPEINEDCECRVEYDINDTLFDMEEDSDGELRVLNAEIGLKIFAEGYGKKNIEVVEDAYSRYFKIGMEKELIKSEETFSENKSQIILKDTMQTEDEDCEIAEIFNVVSKPVISELIISDEKVVIEGSVNNTILYLAENNPQAVFACTKEVPFKHSVDIRGIKPEMQCEAEAVIDNCSHSSVSPKEVELRVVIGMNIRVINQIQLSVISKANDFPMDDRGADTQPSVVIYFTKPGDTLWKIAKKYCTTVDDIERVNNMADYEAVIPGQQILIPRKIS
ncbi:LysM repeat protein [Anaerobacterium chartisolvens]|uniref:LysM repeat protein n=1 Tax=Anaerobacterium chartisolvens TaxID=1297424 RepID=A0A369B3Q6_9FIRM|nr:SPOCS domain-containing protein [Anaerobacterium chartisolvens]RCX16081.1 LysM repeat protein [Anaerobacterium chartisolvens]